MDITTVFDDITATGVISALTPYVLRFLSGLALLIIGWKCINIFRRYLRKVLLTKIDENIAPFITNIVTVTSKVLLVITALSTMGIETTAFAALVGAAGLAG